MLEFPPLVLVLRYENIEFRNIQFGIKSYQMSYRVQNLSYPVPLVNCPCL